MEFGFNVSLGLLLQPPLRELAAHLLGKVLTTPKIMPASKQSPVPNWESEPPWVKQRSYTKNRLWLKDRSRMPGRTYTRKQGNALIPGQSANLESPSL